MRMLASGKLEADPKPDKVIRQKEKSPCGSRGFEADLVALELEHGRQLDAAWTTAADERIADSHVTGRGDGISTACASDFPAAHVLESASARVRDEGREEGIGEVGVVQQIEEVSAELHREPLCQIRSLVNREVPFFEGRANQ